MFEAVTVIAGFDDVAVMSKPIQQCCGELFVNKHIAPLREAQVGGDNDAGFFIEFADQVEQQCATGLAERQIAQLYERYKQTQVPNVPWTQLTHVLVSVLAIV